MRWLGRLGNIVRIINIVALTSLAFIAASAPDLGSPASARTRTVAAAACNADSYINSSGHCVHRPVKAPTAPAGASAKCRDGTFSFSEHRQGTCSHHGGVAQWL